MRCKTTKESLVALGDPCGEPAEVLLCAFRHAFREQAGARALALN